MTDYSLIITLKNTLSRKNLLFFPFSFVRHIWLSDECGWQQTDNFYLLRSIDLTIDFLQQFSAAMSYWLMIIDSDLSNDYT
jgi:hypothetical protein